MRTLRKRENYIILWEYIKYVLPPLTEVVVSTMNLINRTHYFCERREYAFNVLPEYDIIIQEKDGFLFKCMYKTQHH
jgi:hypothetical protein